MAENNLTESVKKLLWIYENTPKENFYTEPGPKVKVSDMVSRFASVYEKVRNVVDFREEHLLRKHAIKRILKRRLMIVGLKKGESIARPMIEELIRARYLPNDTIPEAKIQEVDLAINKYLFFMKRVNDQGQRKDIRKLVDWILSIGACEIEERLVPSPREKAMVEYMYHVAQKEIDIPDKKIPPEQKDIIIYINTLRALLKADAPLLEYHLLRIYYPEWLNADREMVEDVAQNIDSTREKMEKVYKSVTGDKVLRILKHYTIVFLVLHDILEEDPQNARLKLENTAVLEEQINEEYMKRYTRTKSKLNRSIIRSILYIFITKMAIAIAIEVPIDYYLLGELNYVAIGINIIFFPILLFLIAMTIRIPKEKNLIKITSGIKKIIFSGKKPLITHEIKNPAKRSKFFVFIFRIFYAIMFIIPFALIITGLVWVDFSVPSIFLFLLFLSIVSFFGIRLRQMARELVIVEKKESFTQA
ncbi:hypothetical protein KKC88_02845, partial [Patescibacteria group bacterium]|nr:hypothetical protein [Patescibacteria group bacterium]MBU1673809.1 hypothetical protein [Patescibacteria group bacterium]